MRITPTDEWLAESRRHLNVPDHYQWGWCEICEQIVWFPPAAREAIIARGRPWVLVCSKACSYAWTISNSGIDAN